MIYTFGDDMQPDGWWYAIAFAMDKKRIKKFLWFIEWCTDFVGMKQKPYIFREALAYARMKQSAR